MNENLIDVLEASWMMMIENYELRMTLDWLRLIDNILPDSHV